MYLNDWNVISSSRITTFIVCFLAFVAILVFDSNDWIFIIDNTNLVFHEAGHPIFGIFGPTLGLYGGTLGQLFFPSVCAVVFWRQGFSLSYAVALLWFFENFFGIARYMADARAQALPLVGGGGHDWAAIFTRWNVLEYDTTIACIVRIIGWLGILSVGTWVVFRWWQDKNLTVEGGSDAL